MIRILHALATANGWYTVQMDVVTAFLNPKLNEVVYMELLEGYDWLEEN